MSSKLAVTRSIVTVQRPEIRASSLVPSSAAVGGAAMLNRLLLLPALVVFAAACSDTALMTGPEASGSPLFAVAPGALTIQTVSAGTFHNCAVTTAGVAYCWGQNSSGQLGDGRNTDSNVPVAVSGGLTFQSVSAGDGITCGMTTSGTGYCWGFNANGQRGDGTTTASNVPVAVTGGLAFQSISAGSRHSCGETTTGTANCWGWNFDGQRGDGTNTDSNVPVAVSGGLTFQSVSAGGQHSCGVTAAGAGYCWGINIFDGQLGDGTNTNSNVPVALSGGLTLQSVAAGRTHSCGVTTAGAGYCWGDNPQGSGGRLGDGTNADSNVPVAVVGGLTFRSISAGGWHSCGVTTADVPYCWGFNGSGRLGSGTTTDTKVPVAVSGGLTFTSVSAGAFHGCGATTAGSAYCWGRGVEGQRGDGTNTSASNVPVLVLFPASDDEAPVTANTTAITNPVAANGNVDLTANVDDANTSGSNITSAEYSLDGGAFVGMVASDGTFDEVTEDVEASFNAPAEPGIYDLCVRGTDDPGNVGDPECIMLVVYDPTGGFVTGGGWIDSPAGAYVAEPGLTGKANFGFVSKYKKGATVPTGNTEFRFTAGALNFHSTSYDFLVITMGGTNAQYKGSGTINGGLTPAGNEFKFMIWARDDSPDTFRIKIWYEDIGEVLVYDNGFDQPIDGGSIVIHTK